MPPGKSHPVPLRRILPRQSEAQAADLARTLALQDPVQPPPLNTDDFQDTDFGNFGNFGTPQGFLYPPGSQNQMYSQIDEAMLSPNHVTSWQGSMQAWGGFSGRNAAGFGQLSMDTSATQMHGMGNAAGTSRIASDAETHAGTCTDCLPASSSTHGDMDLVSPMSTGEQGSGPFQSSNGLTDCELHLFFFSPFVLLSSLSSHALPCH
jgi:hypothetical protein